MPDAPAVSLLSWPWAGDADAAVAVTTRHHGVSAPPYDTLNLGLHVGDAPEAVVTNRARAAAAFGVGLDTLVFARQVHGTTATLVGPDDAGRGTRAEDDALPDTDILVTTSPGVTLAILVADCVPLALVDPAARVLAAVHAGWRGTAGGAVAAALGAMEATAPGPSGYAPSSGRLSRRSGIRWATRSGPRWAQRRFPRRSTPGWHRPTARVIGSSTSRPPTGNSSAPPVSPRRTSTTAAPPPTTTPSSATAPVAPVVVSPCWPACSTDRSTTNIAVACVGPGRDDPPFPLVTSPHDTFRYDGYAVDPATSTVRCRYAMGEHTFTEEFTFEPGGDWDDPAVHAAVRLLSLVAGVSHDKTTAAGRIDLGDLATTDRERAFLVDYYVNGLGEFAYRNGLDLRGLEVQGPDAGPDRSLPTTPRPVAR